ncbi:MAG: hypothetical protein Q7T85_06050, partial [Nitrosomonas sp.]|nr:hypothetical protein [Nitrosomonas sp.]
RYNKAVGKNIGLGCLHPRFDRCAINKSILLPVIKFIEKNLDVELNRTTLQRCIGSPHHMLH